MSDSATRNESASDQAGGEAATQFAAFGRIWADSFTRMLQLASTYTPDTAPPEMMRQLRSSLFQALSQSWDEYLRSPQFMQATKQWIEQVVNFRQLTNDYLTQIHHEMQSPPRQDIDAVLLSVRHLERRLLDRLEQIEARLDAVAAPGAGPANPKKASRGAPKSDPAPPVA